MVRALVATFVAAFLAACGVSLQAPTSAPAGGYGLQGLDSLEAARGSQGSLDRWISVIDSNVTGADRAGYKGPRPRRTPAFPF
jgi:hypothetical protein